jgi:hypothetical protein
LLQKSPTKNHTLDLAFTGSANVVYNGSFFYFNAEKEAIVKLDLATRELKCLAIPRGRQKHRVTFIIFRFTSFPVTVQEEPRVPPTA